jgi:hypothetical protein
VFDCTGMFMFPLNGNFDNSDLRARLLAILDIAGGTGTFSPWPRLLVSCDKCPVEVFRDLIAIIVTGQKVLAILVNVRREEGRGGGFRLNIAGVGRTLGKDYVM